MSTALDSTDLSAANNRLAGKVAIVTGAGPRGPVLGIGQAIAVVLAAAGARVCLVGRDARKAQPTLDAIAALGGDAWITPGDVTKPEDAERIVAETIERCGRLDVLMNGVGVREGAPGTVPEVDPDAWDEQFTINLKSVMLMSKYAIPPMIEGGGGSIISLTSVAGLLSHAAPAHGTAKAAIVQLTRELALAHGRDLVRANAIAPGYLYTSFAALSQDGDPEMTAVNRGRRRHVAPLGFEGSPWDIAWAALFLASDESRFVSGQCLTVDGGALAMAPLLLYKLGGAGADTAVPAPGDPRQR